jgi:hypothetical protein
MEQFTKAELYGKTLELQYELEKKNEMLEQAKKQLISITK